VCVIEQLGLIGVVEERLGVRGKVLIGRCVEREGFYSKEFGVGVIVRKRGYLV
jgi:hypothetical protein